MAARVLGQTRWATWDALPVALALAHGALLLVWPSIPLVAVGLWWNANTISHQFIRRPFFRQGSIAPSESDAVMSGTMRFSSNSLITPRPSQRGQAP